MALTTNVTDANTPWKRGSSRLFVAAQAASEFLFAAKIAWLRAAAVRSQAQQSLSESPISEMLDQLQRRLLA